MDFQGYAEILATSRLVGIFWICKGRLLTDWYFHLAVNVLESLSHTQREPEHVEVGGIPSSATTGFGSGYSARN